MLKKITAIVLSLIFGLSVGVSLPVGIVFAQAAADPGTAAETGGSKNARDPNTLRVYYSESIGAGQQVYHLSVCEKAPAFAPLTCSQALVDADNRYKDSCVDKEGKVTDKEGEKINGCIKHSDGENSAEAGKMKYTIGGQDFELPYYSIWPPTDKKCLTEVDNQALIYGRKWAVVEFDTNKTDTPAGNDSNINNIVGSVTWPNEGDEQKLIGYGSTIFSTTDSMDIALHPAFEIKLCASTDMLINPDGSTGKQEDPPDSATAAVQMITANMGEFKKLIDAGCNNDNSKESTSLNDVPALSCTISERIDGKSGTDLLARYVGAIYRWAAGVIGIISVLVIVISGIQITVDTSGLEKAKERIMQSLMGLVLLFLSALILYTINPTFFTG